MTTLEVLKAAYHLLDDQERWARHNYAVDANGFSVASNDANAVAWCAAGAICKVSGLNAETADVVHPAVKALASAIRPNARAGVVPDLNDGPDGYQKIRAAFRKAIAELEPQGKRTPVDTPELVAV